MDMSGYVFVFALDGQRYALHLAVVVRATPAAHIVALPSAPNIVMGVIDVAGRVIPVINLRRRFGLPERTLALTDRLVIAHNGLRQVALVADSVDGVLALPAAGFVPVADIADDLGYLDGIAKLPDGLILIHDLSRFLSLDEQTALDLAVPAR